MPDAFLLAMIHTDETLRAVLLDTVRRCPGAILVSVADPGPWAPRVAMSVHPRRTSDGGLGPGTLLAAPRTDAERSVLVGWLTSRPWAHGSLPAALRRLVIAPRPAAVPQLLN